MADNKRSRKYDILCGNPDYAVICSFLNKFSSLLSLPDITFENLERWIGEQRPIPSTFKDFLLCLLKRWRSSANDERFFKYLLKFCESYSPNDAVALEQFGFEKCNADVKLRLVKNLIEQQFDTNVKFKDKVNMISADELRVQPIGKDVRGRMYWSFMDHDMNLRIFCGGLKGVSSNTCGQNWEIIARNRGELLELITSLQNSDLSVDKLFSISNDSEYEDDDGINNNGTINAEQSMEFIESCQEGNDNQIIKTESDIKDEKEDKEELAGLADEKEYKEELAGLADERKDKEELAGLADEKEYKEELAGLADERKDKEELVGLAGEKEDKEELAGLAGEKEDEEELAGLADEKEGKEELVGLADEKEGKEELVGLADEREDKEELAGLADEKEGKEELAGLADEKITVSSEAWTDTPSIKEESAITYSETKKANKGSVDKVELDSDCKDIITGNQNDVCCSDDQELIKSQNEFRCDSNTKQIFLSEEGIEDHFDNCGNISRMLSDSHDIASNSNKSENSEVHAFEEANNCSDVNDTEKVDEIISACSQLSTGAINSDHVVLTNEKVDVLTDHENLTNSKQNLNEIKTKSLQSLKTLCFERLNSLNLSNKVITSLELPSTSSLSTDVLLEEHAGGIGSRSKVGTCKKFQYLENACPAFSALSSTSAKFEDIVNKVPDSQGASEMVSLVSIKSPFDPPKEVHAELRSRILGRRKRNFKSCIQSSTEKCRKRGISESELSESSLGSCPEDSGAHSSAPEDGPPMKRQRNKALLNRFRRNELHSLSRIKDQLNCQRITNISFVPHSHQIRKEEIDNETMTSDHSVNKDSKHIGQINSVREMCDESLFDKGPLSCISQLKAVECEQGCHVDTSVTTLSSQTDGNIDSSNDFKKHDIDSDVMCTTAGDNRIDSFESQRVLIEGNATDKEICDDKEYFCPTKLPCREIGDDLIPFLPLREGLHDQKNCVDTVQCQDLVDNLQNDPEITCNGGDVTVEFLMKSGSKRSSDTRVKRSEESDMGTKSGNENSLTNSEPVAAKKRCCDLDHIAMPRNDFEADEHVIMHSHSAVTNETPSSSGYRNFNNVNLSNDISVNCNKNEITKVAVIETSKDTSKIVSIADQKNDSKIKDLANVNSHLPTTNDTILRNDENCLETISLNCVSGDGIENEENKCSNNVLEIENSDYQSKECDAKDHMNVNSSEMIDDETKCSNQNGDQSSNCPIMTLSICSSKENFNNEENKSVNKNLKELSESDKADIQKKPKKVNICNEEGPSDFIELRRSSRVNKGQRKIEMLELEFPSRRRRKKEDLTEEDREKKQAEKERRRTEKMMRQMAEEYEEILQAKKDKKKRFRMINDDNDDDEDFVPGMRRSLRGKRKKQSNDDDDEEDDDTDSFSEDDADDDEHTIETRSSSSEDEVLVLESDGSLYEPTGRNARRVASLKNVLESENNEQSFVDQQCLVCDKKSEPEFMLLCDNCDGGYHTWCLRPILYIIPDGDWFCPPCEHKMLLERLQKQLCDYDEKAKLNVKLTSRKERLAFVNISLNNLLMEKDLDELPEKLNDNESRCTTYSSNDDENDKSAGESCNNDDCDEYNLGNDNKLIDGGSDDIHKENKEKSHKENDDDDNDTFTRKKLPKKRNRFSSSESEAATDFDNDEDDGDDDDDEEGEGGDGLDNPNKLIKRKYKKIIKGKGRVGDSDDIIAKKKERKNKIIDTEVDEEDDDENDEVEGDWLVTRRSRRQRKEISYKFEEYENLISGAIEDDIKETYGAGNYGRGKDMANITAAKKNSNSSTADSKKRRKKKRFSVLDSDDDGGDCDDEDDESEEFRIDDTSIDDEDEEEDVATELDQSEEEEGENKLSKIPKKELDSLSRKSKRSKKRSHVYDDFVVEEDDLTSNKLSKRPPARRAVARRRINYNEYSDDENDEDSTLKREKNVDLSEDSRQHSPLSGRSGDRKIKDEEKRNRKRVSRDDDRDDDYLEDEDDEEEDEDDFTPGYREGYSDDDLRNFIKSGSSSSSSTCSSSPSHKAGRRSTYVNKNQKKKKCVSKSSVKNSRQRKRTGIDSSTGNKNIKRLKNAKKKRKRKPWYTSDSEDDEEEASVARDSYSDDDFSNYTAPPPQKRAGRRALRYKDDPALESQSIGVKPLESNPVSSATTCTKESVSTIMQVNVTSPQNLSKQLQVTQSLLPTSTSNQVNSSALKTILSTSQTVQRLNSPNPISGHHVTSPNPPLVGIIRQRVPSPHIQSNQILPVPNVSSAIPRPTQFVAIVTQTAALTSNVSLPALQAITTQRTHFAPHALAGGQRLISHEPFTISATSVHSFRGQRSIPPLPPLYPIVKNSYIMNAPVAMAMRSGMSSFGGISSVAPPPPPPLQGRKMNEDHIMVNPFNEKLSSFSVRNITSAAPRNLKPAYGVSMHDSVEDYIVQDLDISEFLNTDQSNL